MSDSDASGLHLLSTRFRNGQGESGITERHHRGRREEDAGSEPIVDPAAEQRVKDRDDVVDGNARGKRRRELLLRIGQRPRIEIRRNRTVGEDGVKDVVDANDRQGDRGREEILREAIEKADTGEDDRVPDHHVAIAPTIHETSDESSAPKRSQKRADREKDRDMTRLQSVGVDQDKRTEGEKHLLARAIEELQRIELRVLAAKIEFRSTPHAFTGLGLAHREDDTRAQQRDHHHEYGIVQRTGGDAVKEPRTEEEHRGRDETARDRAGIHHARHETERFAALPVLRQHQRKGLADGHDGVFAQAPERNQRDGTSPGNGEHQKTRRENGDDCADSQDAPIGEATQQRQDRDEQHTRDLAHELQDAAVEAVDVILVDDEIVKYRVEASHADAPHENAREEGPRPRTGTADLQTSLADAREFHNGQRLYHICRPSEPSDLTHYEDIAVLC